jgi:hypothetical protein
MAGMSAFGQAEFRILWDGGAASMSGWEREAFSNVEHIPGSNRSDTFLLGFGPFTRALNVLCDTQSHYRNLLLMLHTTATLRVPAAMNDFEEDDIEEVVYGGSVFAEIPSVTLMAISGPQKWTDGAVSVMCAFQRDNVEPTE